MITKFSGTLVTLYGKNLQLHGAFEIEIGTINCLLLSV